jgi:CTP:molybdopterin cytidylyltransferase MocA
VQESPATAFRQQLESLYSISIEIARLHEMQQVLDRALGFCLDLTQSAFGFIGLLHPPVVLRRELWGDLMALEGDVGCRAVIRVRPELVARLPVEALNHAVDVDTPDDYKRLLDLRP